jgi:hypothetical protein
MATERSSTSGAEGTSRKTVDLQRFHGRFSPGICFDSGHCFWLFKWEQTPTSLGSYSNIWIITPEGDRLLYADPPEAGPFVEKYHDFDRTTGASITWDRIDDQVLEIHVDGDDGTTLELRAELGSSPATRLLTAISTLTPNAVLRTSVGQTMSNLSLASVMDVNGLKTAGTTETQEPYRFEADRIRAVTTASATLNGDDLGKLGPPGRPIEFGDAKTPDDPFFAVADVFLRPPDE